MVNINSIERMMLGVVMLSVIMLSGCTGLEVPDTSSLL